MHTDDKPTAAIKLQHVYFTYPDTPASAVLNIPTWSVNAKEQVFVHGPSGCGKSTLLKLLGGMLRPCSGELSVLGERLDQLNQAQRDRFRANHIGYVFQQFNLIPYLTAVENVKLATRFAAKKTEAREVEKLLTQLNLEHGDCHKPTRTLSVGQQQRVAIARALINQPELLIADEPTSSLDPYNRDRFMEQLMSMVEAYNTTLVFVSHDLSLSRYFTRIEALPTQINGAA